MKESDDLYVGGMVDRDQVDPSDSLTGDNTEDPLDAGTKLILERGWAEEVSFTDSGARVRGSIEAMPGADMETCHRLRGLLSKLLEAKTKQRVRLAEVECISTGGRECVFERTETRRLGEPGHLAGRRNVVRHDVYQCDRTPVAALHRRAYV